ncbi:MAG: DUF6655 family protein [Planctomycetota bacterium]
MFSSRHAMMALLSLSLFTSGCASTTTSNTARTAKEQLLLSNAVDQSLEKIDFTPLYGQKVFIEEKYLECVDKNYILGSIRHRALRAGAVLTGTSDDADVIMEVRSGGVGTDNTELYVGVPEMPLPAGMMTPEVRLAEKKSQTGYAKLGLVLIDAKTRNVLGDGGVTMARSDDNNWLVLGMGPWQDGSLKGEVATAQRIPHGMKTNRLPSSVAFDSPNRDGSAVRYASDPKIKE